MTEESIFTGALEKSNPGERAAYLDQACEGNAALRARVEALLGSHEGAGSFLDQPAVAEGPTSPPDLKAGTPTLPPPSAEKPGTRIGPYKLLQQIGEGGMGTVWMAEQLEPVRRTVALKVVKAGLDSTQVIARFEAERQALALMDHPNIARVLDAGTTSGEPGGVSPGRPYFVMELVKGTPITNYCDAQRLSLRQRLELFIPVCQALQHAHQKGIIHRDIKPSNVLIAPYDGKPVVKVIDFGVAKATGMRLTEKTMFTEFGAVIGTLEYMSPEQAELNNQDIDTRSDVYSLGVLLYELLTGSTPLDMQRLRGEAMAAILMQIQEQEPPRPSTRISQSGQALAVISAQRQTQPARLAKLVRGELDWIVMKALEKERGRRYETTSAFAADVGRYLANEVVEARPASVGYRLRKLVRRNKGRVLAGGLISAMLFLVIGLILYGVWRGERQSAERRHEQALSAGRKNDDFKATLDRVEAALTSDPLTSDRLAEAGTLLEQARQQIDDQTTAELQARHERLEKYQRTVHELNDIFEERWMISRSDTRLDDTRAKQRYPALFHQYGLAVGREPAEQSVQKIQRSLIADALSSGMAEWFFVHPKYPGLRLVVDLLDPEPGHTALRGAIANDETDRIKAIGKTIDGSQLAPAYAIGLGMHSAVEDGLRILKAAWTTHPDSFPLALTISSQLAGVHEGNEALGWCRTAIALRPKNPLAHYHYAVALTGRWGMEESAGDVANGIDEFRHTIRLAPKFAKAYGRLAFVLHRKGLASEALAAAEKAIYLDDLTASALAVRYRYLMLDKKDYGEAARVYRQLRKALRDVAGSVPSDRALGDFVCGGSDEWFHLLLDGLIEQRRPFEAYCLFRSGDHTNDRGLGAITDDNPDESLHYPAACAAAMAGTGQGLDAPPPSDRAAIRKRAYEWLTASFAVWKKHAAAPFIWSATVVGLSGSPNGDGLLRLASALAPVSTGKNTDRSTYRQVVHEGMKQWLSDPNLAGVRDDPWLAKLPAEEREQWQRFWNEVRSLRDQTSAPKP